MAVDWHKTTSIIPNFLTQYFVRIVEISGELVKNFSAIKLSDDSHSEELSAEDAKGDLFSRFLSSIHQDGRTCFPLEEPKVSFFNSQNTIN